MRLLPKAVDWEALDIKICGTARDGQQGMKLFSRVAPDIVIVDIMMPEIDGLAFARAARESGRPVRIILLTAYAKFEFAQSAIQLGISDYLLKPLDEERLKEVLAKVVRELDAEKPSELRTMTGKFYEGQNAKSMKLADLPPINLASLEGSIAVLVDQALPGPILEQLVELLSSLFEARTDPDQVGRLMLDVAAMVDTAVIRSYGYPASQRIGRINQEQLGRCSSPLLFRGLVEKWVRDVADSLESIFEASPNYVVVRRARAYTMKNFSRPDLSLPQVAEYAGLSKNYFSEIFHEVAGIRYWEYLTRVRISSAKRLLSTTLLSNTDISEHVGYASVYHFNRVFRRVSGCTPQQYRKRSGTLTGRSSGSDADPQSADTETGAPMTRGPLVNGSEGNSSISDL